ncbi:DEAD/DEAH box helicase [Bdellovibrio sp. ArHS]|uniref:DEAD/DEAH box helicase n=1 Tax=Bdellovibrio sp. ArHS TaxID=1569284 RepID=UPI000B247F6C|nr:DEAD/DEAH box helicase [Bdellovibrio sp. ArHS]
MNNFPEFGLLPSLLKTLKTQRIFTPTEIQRMAIPLLMSGQSVVGVSETGSGKTLTYALPLLHMLKSLEDDGQPVQSDASPRAVVMVPTRDLGEQVAKVFKTFTHDTRLRVRPALGGMSMEQSIRNISGPFEILLATPGRLIQLLEKELIDLSDVRVLVFDEADQMLDKGFLTDSNYIVDMCPQDIPLALFSATVSKNVEEMMNSLFAKAEVLRSQGSGKVVQSLTTKNETVIDGLRWPLFEKLLKKPVQGGTIVFANTREQCDKIAKEMQDKGYKCVLYRGEMDKNERRTNLKKFRNGEVDILISTDLAARGLDLEHVGRVINYHLPQQLENYLHRVGRTARAGREGLVINLVTERDLPLIAKIEGQGATAKDLKARFKDKDGKRLHVKRDEKKAVPSKPVNSKAPQRKPPGKPKGPPASKMLARKSSR